MPARDHGQGAGRRTSENAARARDRRRRCDDVLSRGDAERDRAAGGPTVLADGGDRRSRYGRGEPNAAGRRCAGGPGARRSRRADAAADADAATRPAVPDRDRRAGYLGCRRPPRVPAAWACRCRIRAGRGWWLLAGRAEADAARHRPLPRMRAVVAGRYPGADACKPRRSSRRPHDAASRCRIRPPISSKTAGATHVACLRCPRANALCCRLCYRRWHDGAN